MKLKVKKDFSWAHRGIDVVEYKAGDDIEIDDDDLIKVAIAEGWVAKPAGGGKKNGDQDDKSDSKNGNPDSDKAKEDSST